MNWCRRGLLRERSIALIAVHLRPCLSVAFAALLIAVGIIGDAFSDEIGEADQSSVHCELRFVWGSASPRVFAGTISVETGMLRPVRNLSLQADSIGKVSSPSTKELKISAHSPATFGGLDISLSAPKNARVTIKAQNPQTGEVVRHDASVEELLSGTWIKPLDKSGGRVAFERQVYDRLQVNIGREQAIFRPEESLSVAVTGNYTGVEAGAYILSVGYEAKKPVSRRVVIDESGNFPAVQFPITAPQADGAHLLAISLSREHLLRSMMVSSPVLVRRVDMVVLDDAAASTGIVGWNALAEIDAFYASQPGSLAWLAPEEVRRALPLKTVSDVASKWSYINPLAGSLTNPETSGELGSRTLSSPGGHPGQPAECLTLGAHASVTFPLGQLKPGVPHRLSISYPTDQPMHLAVVVKPRGSEIQQSVDSAIRLEPIACTKEGDVARHEVVFWPDEATSSVTLYNPHEYWTAAIKTVLVSAAENGQVASRERSQRHTGVYLSQPILIDAMATRRDPDPMIGRRYEGWRTWYTALERLGQYMSWMEADTLFVSVFSNGGGILVNDTLSPTLRFDSGTFFSDSRSPNQKDVVELLLRMADRDHRRVVLMLNVDSAFAVLADLPEERSPESLMQRSVHDATEPQLKQYNPLHASVQAAMQSAIKEIMSRYSKHESFAGVGLQLSRDSQLVFRGDTWGYSPSNLLAFEQHTGGKLSTAVKLDEVFQQDSIRAAYLSWRATQLTEFYRQLTNSVRSAKPDAKLYINLSRLWQKRLTADDFYDIGGSLRSPESLMLACGIDAAQLAVDDGIELIAGGRPRGDDSVNSMDWMLDLASQQSLVGLSSRDQLTSIVQIPSTSIEIDSEKDGSLSIYPALIASGRHAVKDLIDSVYQADRTQIATGNWAPRQGDIHWQRELFSTLRAFPPVALTTTDESAQSNVRERWGTHNGKTYFQVINNAPWPETVTMTVQHPAEAIVRELGIGPSRLQHDDSSRRRVLHTWSVQLRPFDIAGIMVDSADVELLSVDHTSPESALQHIATELVGVESVVSKAGDPTQQVPMVDLGGDFERWNTEERPFGWTLSSLPQVSLDKSDELPHSGRASLMITNRGRTNTSAWIQSRPLVPPQTGRLLVSTWLRVSAASDPVLVRISVSGRLDNGETFERWELVGGLSPDKKRLPIDWGRQPFQLYVSDMPLEQLKSLRVGVELIGSGRVWIDDVEAYELQLMPHEWRHLRGQILVAKDRLAEGNPYPAYRLLESHWGQYASRLGYAPERAGMTPASEDVIDRSASSWNSTTPVFEKWRETLRQRWSK